MTPSSESLNGRDWPAIVGWLIFGVLLAAEFAGRPLFTAFGFGLAYCASYLIFSSLRATQPWPWQQTSRRVLILGLMVLAATWARWSGDLRRADFTRELEYVCSRPHAASGDGARVCEDVWQAVDAYLLPEPDFSDE